MKTSRKIMFIVQASILLIFSSSLFAQVKSDIPKLKSVTVYDEKFDNIISKKVKESEVTYDAHGNMLEEIYYTANKVTKHFQYQYDAADNKIKEIEFDPSGKVSRTSEYKYEKGLRTEKLNYGSDGKLKTRKTYVYTSF